MTRLPLWRVGFWHSGSCPRGSPTDTVSKTARAPPSPLRVFGAPGRNRHQSWCRRSRGGLAAVQFHARAKSMCHHRIGGRHSNALRALDRLRSGNRHTSVAAVVTPRCQRLGRAIDVHVVYSFMKAERDETQTAPKWFVAALEITAGWLAAVRQLHPGVGQSMVAATSCCAFLAKPGERLPATFPPRPSSDRLRISNS